MLDEKILSFFWQVSAPDYRRRCVSAWGASVKDMGAGLCAVTKLKTSSDTILRFLK